MRRFLSERHKDRLATVLIRTGGLLVIVVVVGIVVNIGAEALPLFARASAGPVEEVTSNGAVLLAGSDPRRELVWMLGVDGVVRLDGAAALEPIHVFGEEPTSVAAADHEIHGLVAVLDVTGRAAVGHIRFRDSWEGEERRTSALWRRAADEFSFGEADWIGVTANLDEDGNLLLAAWDRSGSLALASWDSDDEDWEEVSPPAMTAGVSRVAIGEDLAAMAVLDSRGRLRIFDNSNQSEEEVLGTQIGYRAIRFLIGGGTLVVAGAGGSVDVLLEVPRVRVHNGGNRSVEIDGELVAPGESVVVADDEIGRRLASREDVSVTPAATQWTVVRSPASMEAAPQNIAPASRRRGFAVGTEDGRVGLYHATSGRRLMADRWAGEAIDALAIDPKSDGAVAVAGRSVLRRSISNPHPEISFRTLFLPVWYEGYASPKWVWQSTGGSDAFEPKLSVWPLIFGTLKATLYAMLFSLPLALLAAIYVSQLAPSWLQSVVKPTLELMAAVPSVVVGFLAALWLAPRLEAALLAVLIAAVVLPLSVFLALAVWRALPADTRRRIPEGSELLVLLAAGAAVTLVVGSAAGPIESRFFSGDIQRFLFTDLGMRYDQRNSIVVGLALGFAVIPVIFTIAEDACSAVPRALVNASRALGATRWQTAIKLVVPAASPGLFAAVMLGLGRAVGETMIVLMAAGNTPLLDLSIFNGMRTMSAAIAVEIPEAPVGGTLFRVLFLTGTLLFLFTFVLTTAADFVGSYLRKKYARF